jgi:hypothetical protein
MWNKEHDESCAAYELGLEKVDKRNCNVRKLYTTLVKRQVHDTWLDKKREEWNSYQLAWRKNKEKNEKTFDAEDAEKEKV